MKKSKIRKRGKGKNSRLLAGQGEDEFSAERRVSPKPYKQSPLYTYIGLISTSQKEA